MSPASRVNDFVLKFANVNGTGSASANTLVMKTVFRMGVPVVGKNYFPSNIQGLPTWYEVRVTGEGHRARAGRVDLMVAMNAETYARDLAEVSPGGWLLYDSSFPRPALLARDDITVLGVPLAEMCNAAFDDTRTRLLMKNIMIAGVLAALLELELEVIRGLLGETYAKKPALVEANMRAVQMGHDWARANLACPLPIRVARLDRTAGHIVIDGNTAAAMGCLYAGATVGAWYPITPSTSLMDAFKSLCEKHRVDAVTGERRFAIVQAEDELSAIGVVIGAMWNGARAFTPTSGPGISLMGEFVGLAYYAEVPAVIFDVQRTGPSTGMPTRTQQCDILACAFASHGDTRHVLLFPADPAECFEHAVIAFDLAERLQTPVFVLSDLDIGMNDWMVPEFQWDDAFQPDRGKVLDAAAVERLQRYGRYVDSDGDGIPYRTLPGTSPKAAFFTRGSGHTEWAGYTEDSVEYQKVVDRLRRKSDTAARLVPAPVLDGDGQAAVGIISLGSCDGAVREALGVLRREGAAVDYLRVKGFPFSESVGDFIRSHRRVFVVEQNRDAQLLSLLALETGIASATLTPVLHYSGLPITADCVLDELRPVFARGAAA
jgi:2-oxoglutarate ferredoxin oxidoreductase subunit alpha